MNVVRHAVLGTAVVAASSIVGWSGCSSKSASGFGSGTFGATSSGGGGSEDGSLVLTQEGSDGGSSSGGGIQYMFSSDGGIVATGACPGGGSTTISGKIYDPAAKDPLYGAVAYVPSKPVSPLHLGASCDTCNSLYTGSPIAAGQTDATGSFTIDNAPSGPNIPLVIQLGKWRKQLTIKNVAACTNNPQPDKSLTLPANHMEGDIPNIAISTGGADTLECLLIRMGVDPAEYEPGAQGPGRIHIFQGSGAGGFLSGLGLNLAGVGAPNTSPAAPTSSAALWNSDADILDFDMVMLSCEGSPTSNMDQQVLFDYAAMGGRVFASHYHYAWFNTGPFSVPTPALATWNTTGDMDIGNINALVQTTLLNGGAFPKGVAMKEWLGNVGALGVSPTSGVAAAPAGELPIVAARHNANLTAANSVSTSWIVPDSAANQSAGTTQYFSFNTPLGAGTETQCGRVVYSDLHVGGASDDNPTMPVPQECSTADLSPQEKALEFMLFDLGACVVPDNAPPPMVMITPQ